MSCSRPSPSPAKKLSRTRQVLRTRTFSLIVKAAPSSWSGEKSPHPAVLSVEVIITILVWVRKIHNFTSLRLWSLWEKVYSLLDWANVQQTLEKNQTSYRCLANPGAEHVQRRPKRAQEKVKAWAYLKMAWTLTTTPLTHIHVYWQRTDALLVWSGWTQSLSHLGLTQGIQTREWCQGISIRLF